MRNRILALFALQACTILTGVATAASSTTARAVEAVSPPSASGALVVHVRPVARALQRPAPVPVPPAPRTAHRAVHRHASPLHAGQPRMSRPRPLPVRRTVSRPPASVSLTPQQRLDQAVARIPGDGAKDATWLLQAKDGFWGTADWYHNVVWVSPRVPANRVYDVAVHEWSHLKSVKAYGGNVDAAVNAMNTYFGGSGLDGAERAADCMARLDGATWTHYTSCQNGRWRAGAARLLAGQQL